MSFGKVSHNIPYILEKTKDNIDFDNYYLPLLGKAPKQIELTWMFCKKLGGGAGLNLNPKFQWTFLGAFLNLSLDIFKESRGGAK